MKSEFIVAIFGVIFIVLQFVFRLDSRKIVDSTVESFDKHVEESTEIHTMVEDLAKLHDVKDQEGRHLVHMPPSVITGQNDMVKIMHVLAQTQKATVAILERLERKIDK